MKKYKLKRAIKDHNDNDVKELQIKDDNDICASDFYNIQVNYGEDGQVKETLGDLKDAIANVCGLTTAQVNSMHPSDYIKLSAIVGKFLM